MLGPGSQKRLTGPAVILKTWFPPGSSRFHLRMLAPWLTFVPRGGNPVRNGRLCSAVWVRRGVKVFVLHLRGFVEQLSPSVPLMRTLQRSSSPSPGT